MMILILFFLCSFDGDLTKRQSVWSVSIGGGLVTYLLIAGIQQTSVQRYSAVSTFRAAQLSVLLNIPVYLVLLLLCITAGFTVYAVYALQGCDPVASGKIDSSNQVRLNFPSWNYVFRHISWLLCLFFHFFDMFPMGFCKTRHFWKKKFVTFSSFSLTFLTCYLRVFVKPGIFYLVFRHFFCHIEATS